MLGINIIKDRLAKKKDRLNLHNRPIMLLVYKVINSISSVIINRLLE